MANRVRGCQPDALRLRVKQTDGVRVSAFNTETLANLDEAHITRASGEGIERSHQKRSPARGGKCEDVPEHFPPRLSARGVSEKGVSDERNKCVWNS